jgi:hypothetical protein
VAVAIDIVDPADRRPVLVLAQGFLRKERLLLGVGVAPRVKSKNISVGLRTIPVPAKMILDSFQNNFGLVIFICEQQPNQFRQLRNISGFYPGKFPEVSRIKLAPSKNYQACAETILT